MILGSPMYLDPLEETNRINPVILRLQNEDKKAIHHYSRSVPSDASNFHLEEIQNSENPFASIVEMRSKYILSSAQDSSSNAKNDVKNWLLYPEPLPKFWKFEYDKRFNGDYLSANHLSNQDELDINFTPDPTPLPELETLPQSNTVHIFTKNGKKIHFTGEYFDLDQYSKLEKKTKSRNTLSPMAQLHSSQNQLSIPTFDEFKSDFSFIIDTIQSHKLNEIAEKRLQYLLDKFELFQYLSSKSEIQENKLVPYRDFYNSRKIDMDYLLSGCVTQRQLSEFIWEKINLEPNRPVYIHPKTKEILTLKQIFEISCAPEESMSIGLKVIEDEFLEWYQETYLLQDHLIPGLVDPYTLPSKKMRFFLLTQVFLEFDNFIKGEYLAELIIRYIINPIEKSKYQLIQMSVDFQFYPECPDYNETENWWNKFSDWLSRWNLISYNIRWNVQISRIFTKLFTVKRVSNFQEFLNMIFDPLLKTSKYMGHLQLRYFLTNVCSLDLVINRKDAYLWKEFTDVNCPPINWEAKGDNPTIAHYMYYLFAGIAKLNTIRQDRGENAITLRNNCSPTSNRTSQFGTSHVFTDQIESLVCNLLLCNGGLLQGEPIWKTQSLMLPYLFYLFQIPIIVAPLSSVSSLSSFWQSIQTTSGNSKQSSPSPPPPNSPSSLIYEEQQEPESVKPIYTRDITLGEQPTYSLNPFMKMFKIGFKVTISSKSVLFNSSYTSEPIIEEFSVAASIYLLNAADLCELSRNSVISSGYEGWYKKHWAGVTVNRTDLKFPQETLGMIDEWYDNEIDTRIKHNVPMIRRGYRKETWDQEWIFINEQIG